MQYYRLVYSDVKDDRLPQGKKSILVNSYHLDGFDLRSLWRGARIKNWNKNILLYYSDGEIILDFIPNNLSWLIFSDRAACITQTLATEVEVFPVSISSESNNTKIQANVINVLTSISAMNWEKSDYILWDDDPKEIKAIRNLVINHSAIVNNTDMFRLEESKNFIVVSERFKREVEQTELIGFGFWEIDVV